MSPRGIDVAYNEHKVWYILQHKTLPGELSSRIDSLSIDRDLDPTTNLEFEARSGYNDIRLQILARL